MAKSKTKTESNTDDAAVVTIEDRLSDLRETLRYETKAAKAVIAALAKELANCDRDAIEVLAWSISAFDAAATLQVVHEISARLDAGESIAEVHARLVSDVLSASRSGRGSSSTSPTRNCAEASKMSAAAKFENLLRYAAMKVSATEVKS